MSIQPVQVRHVGVRLRRALARRPWVRWLVVVGLATAVAASALERADRVDRARAAWGDTEEVLVADGPMRPGDPLAGDWVRLPIAVVPPGAIARADDAEGRTVRQHVGEGEIVTEDDLAVRDGPLALVPAGRVAVPVVESPPSAADPGERVRVVSDGIVLAEDAIVVGLVDDVTLVAVDAAIAPLLPAAGESGRITLLRVP